MVFSINFVTSPGILNILNSILSNFAGRIIIIIIYLFIIYSLLLFVVFWLVDTSSSNNKTNHDKWGK